jgi:hypothetical protein
MSSNESLISSLKTVSPHVENEKNPCIMCRTAHMFICFILFSTLCGYWIYAQVLLSVEYDGNPCKIVW